MKLNYEKEYVVTPYSWMSKVLVPRILAGEKSMRYSRRFCDRVKISSAATPKKNPTGHKIFNRKTEGINFNAALNDPSDPSDRADKHDPTDRVDPKESAKNKYVLGCRHAEQDGPADPVHESKPPFRGVLVDQNKLDESLYSSTNFFLFMAQLDDGLIGFTIERYSKEITRDFNGGTTGPTRRYTKGQWNAEEDETLHTAVKQSKGKNWKKIAECFKDETDVQCLHQWQTVLNPELIKARKKRWIDILNNLDLLDTFQKIDIVTKGEASYGTVVVSCQISTLYVRKYRVSDLSSCAGSELGSELTFLAGSELGKELTSLAGSELGLASYRLIEDYFPAICKQELCPFNFLLASCQDSSSELSPASYRLIEDNSPATCEQEF
uniref:Transcription factor MYB3R-1-like isoform X1 n=1 Tax=Tanacetum cinerariifolium TaxID=118510 RepID=A0A6L2LQY9_TANCI|nr:transcription factor MYB3R-1-like isoform X1 [Tanacetum cinerariifolium]